MQIYLRSFAVPAARLTSDTIEVQWKFIHGVHDHKTTLMTVLSHPGHGTSNSLLLILFFRVCSSSPVSKNWRSLLDQRWNIFHLLQYSTKIYRDQYDWEPSSTDLLSFIYVEFGGDRDHKCTAVLPRLCLTYINTFKTVFEIIHDLVASCEGLETQIDSRFDMDLLRLCYLLYWQPIGI